MPASDEEASTDTPRNQGLAKQMTHRRLQLHRPHRFVHQGMAQFADLLFEFIAVIGGDHHGRDRCKHDGH